MGIFNNIDHELLAQILAEKLAGYSESEVKTFDERAEIREQQKLDNDAAKANKAEGSTAPKPSIPPKPQKLPDQKPVKLTGTDKTPEDFDIQGARVKTSDFVDDNPLATIALGALAAGGAAYGASRLSGKVPRMFSSWKDTKQGKKALESADEAIKANKAAKPVNIPAAEGVEVSAEHQQFLKNTYVPTELSEIGKAWYPLVKQQIGPIDSAIYKTLPKNSLNRLKFNMAEILENSSKLTVGELNALKAAGSHMDDVVMTTKREFPRRFAGSGGIQDRLTMSMENIMADLETGALTPGKAAKLKNALAKEGNIDAALSDKLKNDKGIQELLQVLIGKGL